MTWFKVDDTLAFNRKVVEAGNAAMGLWVRAGAWSASTLTEGRIPGHMIGPLGGRKAAARLVEVQLWDRVGTDFVFRGWGEYQPSKDQVEADRAAARDRQQRARDKARDAREAAEKAAETDPASRSRHGVTYAVTSPSVTVPPTRPDHIEKKTSSSSARKRATSLPKDWAPTESHLAYCIEHDLDPAHQLRQFKTNAEAKGLRYVQWNSAFSTWLGNANQWGQTATAAGGRKLAGVPAAEGAYTAPEPPRDMPDQLIATWNRACAAAHRAGQPIPDWHTLESKAS